MFATPCRSALDIFKSTVLGITPVNSDWKVYFTTAYLSQSMVEGSAFAREIGQTLKEEYYPPTWYGHRHMCQNLLLHYWLTQSIL